MAYQQAIIAQMKTPQNDSGERYDIYFRTHMDAIFGTDDDGNQYTLTDRVKSLICDQITNDTDVQLAIINAIVVVSSSQPSNVCLWCNTGTELGA